MTAPVSDPVSSQASGRRPELVSLGSNVQVAEGELVPALLTLRMGHFLEVTLPLGAFTARNGHKFFVPSVDVVGLAAVTFGIGVGALGVQKMSPIIGALAERIRSR
ncbi:MAG TPA: hypothetical protein VG014_09830 [Acidimicrobiales bacterium]|jgi:hypothetical protein|nr:hypothetical protein [Acidimicrobiales bacterium]